MPSVKTSDRFDTIVNSSVGMDPLSRAENDFKDLARELRRHGANLDLDDVDLQDLADEDLLGRLVDRYSQGREEDAKDLLGVLLKTHMRARMGDLRQQADRIESQVEREREALSAWENELDVDSELAFVLGRNLTVIRRTVGVSKSALARRVDVISRPTLINVEKGQGARLEVVEALADALEVPDEVLLLASSKLGLLYNTIRPLDAVQALLHEVIDWPNDAVTHARDLASDRRLEPETLRVVGDVLEFVDERYDTRAARAGAAVGWLWGLPRGVGPKGHDRVTTDLVAGVLGGWWIDNLANARS